MEQLFRRVADRTMPPQRITLECRLQIRESSRAPRTSSGESTTVLGRPVATSRPRISACCSPSKGWPEPMAIFTASAVRSPMAMPYSART